MRGTRLALTLLIALMGRAEAAPVMTADGAVEGIAVNRVQEFLGIPYAAPPVYLFVGYHGGPEGVPTKLTTKQEKLSKHMIAAWANFARTGNPNGAGDAPWPRWNKAGPAVFVQDDAWNRAQTVAEFSAAHQCGFWQSVHYWR
jgi:carboxylesterase type B